MSTTKNIKAVSLFSGGLDSLLAIKLIQEQNIEVTALAFTSPFFISNKEKKEELKKIAKEHNFKIKFIPLKEDYLKLLKNPKHGYGKNINPCIDCHTFMVKKAKTYAKKINAKFIFTGEVLDERPMSQNKKSLAIVAEDSGLKNKLLRPLSAKLLKETEAEKKGYVDRNKLLAIRGRTRKKQLELVKEFKIKKFQSPGGGCLLTNKEYAAKVKDALQNKPKLKDFEFLKIGRHFRLDKNKIIVGRNKKDNELIVKLKDKSDYIFEVPNCGSPTTLLQGPKTKKAIELAAQLTLTYSDNKEKKSKVKYGKTLSKNILVKQINKEKLANYKL